MQNPENFLRNERNERMQQLQNGFQNVAEHAERMNLQFFVVAVKERLFHFDVPVAEIRPHEVVNFACGKTDFVFVEIDGNLFDKPLKLGENPFVNRQFFKLGNVLKLLAFHVHDEETAGVPKLVHEVAAGFHLFFGISGVASRSDARSQTETQGVGAVFVDNLQRIDAVAKRFGHLSALTVADEAVNKHFRKRNFAHVFDAAENHSGNPEEDDVVCGYENVGRVEIFEVFGLFRIAQSGERPKRAGEPCVQNVFVLTDVFSAAFRANFDLGFGNGHFAAVVAIVGRNSVSPPKLTADAPVSDVFHPVEIGFFETFRDKFDFAFFDGRNGRFGKRFHFDEPLLADDRLDDGRATITFADVVLIRFDFHEKAALF